MQINYKKITILFLLLLFTNSVLQATTTDSTYKKPGSIDSTVTTDTNPGYFEHSINFFAVALRAFISLLIIIVLIFGTLFFLKKFIYARKNFHNLADVVKVIGTISLTPKNSLYLVKITDQVLVLGVTEQNIALLSTITDEQIIKKLESDNHTSHGAFKRQLEKLM